MKTFLRFAIVAFALAAAGCSDVVIQDAPGVTSRTSYYPGEIEYATRKGAIATTVLGNPFGGPKEEFDTRVLGLMKHQNRGVPAEFVATQGDRTDQVFNVVVAFNLPANIPARRLCKDPAALSTTPHAGNLRMTAAFCHVGSLQSGTFGIANNLSGPDDPKFAELVRGVTHAMTPAETDPDERGRVMF